MSTFKENAMPFSPGGYMHSAELDSVRGVPAVPVSFRVARLMSPAKRDFVWYLQGLSLCDGGFARLARELVEMFPDRLGTAAMRRQAVKPGQSYPGELRQEVFIELHRIDPWENAEGDLVKPLKQVKGSELLNLCCEKALTFKEPQKNIFGEREFFPERLSIEQFLAELCTNPRLQFSLPGTGANELELEAARIIEQEPGLDKSDFEFAHLVYFQDIIGALIEYRARQSRKIADQFHLTAIGKRIWETLDFALATRRMVLLDGLEGRGKTEAVKAWCELHSGQARFVSLSGVTTKTSVFREIALALGVTYAYGRTSPEMQAKVQDVLKRSKIMLILDEAHFLFNQTRQMTSRPELIDWLDTSIRNNGIPAALITTPQFVKCLARAKKQVEWNYAQFRRRVKFVQLPAQNTEQDLYAVAAKVFPKAGDALLKKIVGYALLSKRDLSAIGDIAAELHAMLGGEGLGRAGVSHIDQAIKELIVSDQFFKVAMADAEQEIRPGRRRTARGSAAEHSTRADATLKAPSQTTGHLTTLAPAPDESTFARREIAPASSATLISE